VDRKSLRHAAAPDFINKIAAFFKLHKFSWRKLLSKIYFLPWGLQPFDELSFFVDILK